MSSPERLADVGVSIELEDEQIVPFPDFATLPDFIETYSKQYRYLHINAPFLEATALEQTGPESFYIQFDLGAGKTHRQLKVDLDKAWEDGASVDLSGICIGTPTEFWAIIVLENMETHYERRGIILTSASSSEYDRLDFGEIWRDFPTRDVRLK